MAKKAGVHAETQKSKQRCSSSCKQKPKPHSSGSPANRILQLQRTAGNQAVQRLVKSGIFQAKLKISQPKDIHEQEADRVAEQVMRMPDPIIQLKCTKCDKDEKQDLQAKGSPRQMSISQSQDALSVVHEVLSSPGQPLNPVIRAFMEPRFGYDFSRVRVHSGPATEQSARDVNAHAYTVGSNIVFNEAQFSPETHRGRRLIAHELAHVVQQSGVNGIYAGEGNEKRDLSPITPDIMVASRPVNNISRVPVTQIQREEISTDDTKLRDESLEIGESIVIESLATGATAGMPSLKPVIKGGFTGFYTEIRHQIKEGKGQQFMDRVKKLLVNPGDMVAYGKGYFWGILQGLWSPVQGIVDIVKLAWKIQQWQIQNIASVIKNFHEIATMQGSLIDRFSKLGGKAKAFFEGFKNNATEFVGRLMGAISGGIVKLAKTGGRKAGQAIFRFLEKTWGEIGEGVGIVVGTVLVEVGLALVSGGVGNALTKVGQALDKVAPTLMKGVRFIASELGAIIAEIRSVVETIKAGLAKMGRSLLKGFEDFISEVGSIFDDLIAMLKKLFSSAEDAATKLPINVPLPIEAPVPHIPAPHLPTLAKPSHVEAVPVKKPHAESLVTKEPNVEAGTPKKPKVELAPPKEPPIAKAKTDAVTFVKESPNAIKGEPGHRHASIGEGHEIVEIPDRNLPSGIGCELHSPPPRVRVPCPPGMGGKGTITTKSPSLQYRDNLVKRYPKLEKAELTPIKRNLGEPGLWEESIYTGSGKESWSAKMRDGTKIQLDDIDASGFVVDTKMRGIYVGREIPPAHVPDVINKIRGAKTSRVFEIFPESEQKKLLKQLRFSKENSLNGVRWETNSPEFKMAVERYAETILSKEEQKLFSIKLVQR